MRHAVFISPQTLVRSSVYFILIDTTYNEINVHTEQSGMTPVAAQSKAWFCGLSLAGIVGSNPAGSMDVCLL
jgi:hypothetical protein